jgi:urease accessory protein
MTFPPRVGLALVLTAAAVSSASAHPLHGSDFASALIHPFAGVDHLLAAVAVGMWAARLGGRATWMVPGGFVTAMLLGFIVAVAGYGPEAVAPMIAVSVVVFGLALFFRFGASTGLATGLVAYFALFHGMAHGTALGGSAMLVAFGLLSATAALHVIGLLAARKLPALIPAAGAALAAIGTWWVAISVV